MVPVGCAIIGSSISVFGSGSGRNDASSPNSVSGSGSGPCSTLWNDADPDVPDSGPVLDGGLENTDVCNGVEVLPVGFLPILV